MREILFRGKRADNGEWIEGSLYYDPDLEQSQIYGFNYTYNSETGEERECFHHLVDYNTVCQYIGLTDKNGRKIFEADIIKIDSYICRVEYSELFAKFYAVYDEFLGNWFDFEGDHCYPLGFDCEVIGNIHDNLELLKGEYNESER